MDQIQPESHIPEVDSLRCRIEELSSLLTNPNDASLTSLDLLQDWIQGLEAQGDQIVSEALDGIDRLRDDNLDTYLAELKEELHPMEAESTQMCNNLELLEKAYDEDVFQLKGDLGALDSALSNVKSEGVMDGKAVEFGDGSENASHRVPKAKQDQIFQALDLNHQVESNIRTLNTLQDLKLMHTRFEAINQMLETISGVKVIEFVGNCIRLALRTEIPRFESHQKFGDASLPSELNHELLLELMDDSLDLKHAEIFPNVVCIRDIFEADATLNQANAGCFRTSSFLSRFLQKVQTKIILCTMRQSLAKTANKSRYSLEYSDDEELITARVRGIDAFIKTSQGWPLSTSVLKLISLQPSGHGTEEISIRLLCEVEEQVNSLDVDTRKSLTRFVDAIEEILGQKLWKGVLSEITPS